MTPMGTITSYSDALNDAAAKKGESVQVTKDIMKFRERWRGQELQETLTIIQNTPGSSWVDKAKATQETIGPFESQVFPAFMTLVAKKQRWTALPDITEFYMQQVYRAQSIE